MMITEISSFTCEWYVERQVGSTSSMLDFFSLAMTDSSAYQDIQTLKLVANFYCWFSIKPSLILSSTNFNISLLNYSSSISFKPLNLFPLISLNTHGSSSGYHWNTNNSYSPFQLCPGWWSISHNSEAPLEFWDGKWIMHLSLFKIYQSKNKTD